MKRTLLATTAIATMSSATYAQEMAMAEEAPPPVALSGSAEMGLADGGSGDAMFHMDADVTFTLAGTTDAGLAFGTALNFDDNAADNKYAVHVGGAFGTVTLGDTDGAFDWALAEVNGASSIADNETGHAGFNGNSGLDGLNILRYNNTFGTLGVAVSFEQEEDDTNGDIIAAGVSGAFGDFGIGAGVQQHDNSSIAGVSVTAAFGDISGAVNYSRLSNDNAADITHVGAGATYAFGATAVNVNFGRHDNGSADNTGFGVAATFDLGGGAMVKFGYGNSDYGYDNRGPASTDPDPTGTTKDTWSLGLGMAF